MRHSVIEIDSKPYYASLVTDDELLLTSKRAKTPEELIAAVQKDGLMASNKRIALDKITGLSGNTSESTVKVTYNKEGKSKSTTLDLSDDERASGFLTFLGEATGLRRHEELEGLGSQLMATLLPVALAVGAFVFFFTLEDPTSLESSGSRRTRGGLAIVRLAFDILGRTGVLLLTGAIVALTIYLLVRRLKNPGTKVTYTAAG